MRNFDLKHKGHEFKILHEHINTHECLKCGMVVLIIEGVKISYLMYTNDRNPYKDCISCNEMIIKNIIE
jgi:hypothetical protein